MPDAAAIINQIIGGLDGLAGEPIRLVGEDRTFMEMWGWNCPSINRHEFAAMIRSPIAPLQSITKKDLDQADFDILEQVPTQISYIQANTFPQLPGGNAFHVYVTVESLNRKLHSIADKYRHPDIEWEEIEEKKLIPKNIIDELRQLQNQVSTMTSRKKELESSIERILTAATASKSLKGDLDNLRTARDNFLGVQRSATEHQVAIEQARSLAEKTAEQVSEHERTAASLVASTQSAFAAATTTGLGSEFDRKAKALSGQVKWLATFLTAVILVAAGVTYVRIGIINELMKAPPINIELIWANVVMSMVSVAGPVWLAWLLTKQIGQRFRLSEDYAFKASVAKAYAGYSEEGARIDPEFQKRLYSTALNRIDEAPLRYVETESDGSPWHGLFRRNKARSDKPGN
jgi:hypothetical protein